MSGPVSNSGPLAARKGLTIAGHWQALLPPSQEMQAGEESRLGTGRNFQWNGNGPGTDWLGVIHWQCGFNLKLLSQLRSAGSRLGESRRGITASG